MPWDVQLSSWDKRPVNVDSCALSCLREEVSGSQGSGVPLALEPPKHHSQQQEVVGLCQPPFALVSAPSGTAVFAFTWHLALSKQCVGTHEQLAGRASTGRVPSAASHCSLCAGFAIKTRIQFELGGHRAGTPGERFTSFTFRGKQICFTLHMLSPLCDGGDDDTRISTWERQLATTGWVAGGGVHLGSVSI